MRQHSTLAMAVLLTFSIASLSFAADAGQKGAKKRTATGTITKVNAKAKTIAVKPTASGQQIQTQKDAKKDKEKGAEGQKSKPKRPRQFVFHIDENTKITCRITQKQGAKGGATEDAEKDPFSLLAAGQVVRVVFVREAVEAKPAQAQQQEDAKKDKTGKGKQQQQDDKDKKGPAKQKEKGKGKPKSQLRALSVDILAATEPQQSDVDKKQSK